MLRPLADVSDGVGFDEPAADANEANEGAFPGVLPEPPGGAADLSLEKSKAVLEGPT